MADVPFLPCTPFWPGEILVARPDLPLVVEHVHELDLDTTLTLTPEAPGSAMIGWAGMRFQNLSGSTAVPATKEVRIGSNLVLSSPAPGVSRLDAVGGAGGTIEVIGGVAFGTIIDPCTVLSLDSASGLKLADGGGGEAVVALWGATPSQAGAVTTGPQTLGGLKTFKLGVQIGLPGDPAVAGNTTWSFVSSPDTGGTRPGFVMADQTTTGGHSSGSGMFWHSDNQTAFLQGVQLADGAFVGYYQTSLAVNDAATVPHVGAWQTISLPHGTSLTFAGGLFISGPASLNWIDTVTSSGGTTGLTLTTTSGSGTASLILGGTLAIGSGGTGATTAAAALTALLPSQVGQAGKVLGTNGTAVSWVAGGGGGGVSAGDVWDELMAYS